MTAGTVPLRLWGTTCLVVAVLVGAIPDVVRLLGAGPRGPAALGSLLAPAALLAVVAGVASLVLGRGATGQAPMRGSAVVVRRFLLQTVDGAVHPCVLQGEFRGGDVRPGDVLRVAGRAARHGRYVVRRVDVLDGPSGRTTRTAASVLRGSVPRVVWVDRVAIALAVPALVWATRNAVALVH